MPKRSLKRFVLGLVASLASGWAVRQRLRLRTI